MKNIASSKRTRVARLGIVTVAFALLLSGCVPSSEPQHGASSASPTASPAPTHTEAPAAAAVDGGPQDAAEGTVQRIAAGQFDYRVVSGDSAFSIASRFGVCMADLYGANDGLEGHTSELAPGDELTITRVEGSDHGAESCALGN